MKKRGNILLGGIFLLIGLGLLKVAMEPYEMLFADPNAMHIMTYPKILLYIWIGASIFYICGKKMKTTGMIFIKPSTSCSRF